MGVFKVYSNFWNLKNNVKNLFNCKKKNAFCIKFIDIGEPVV